MLPTEEKYSEINLVCGYSDGKNEHIINIKTFQTIFSKYSFVLFLHYDKNVTKIYIN